MDFMSQSELRLSLSMSALASQPIHMHSYALVFFAAGLHYGLEQPENGTALNITLPRERKRERESERVREQRAGE